MTIPVHIDPRTKYTVFQRADAQAVFKRKDIDLFARPEDAVLIVSNREDYMTDLVGRYGAARKYLLWTHEPRFWTRKGKWAKLCGQKIRTISAHSGEVYRNNYYYAHIKDAPPPPSPVQPSITLNRKIICIARHTIYGAVIPGDLVKIRGEIALKGHEQGNLDIYGKRWPAGKAHQVACNKNSWQGDKYDLLQGRHFNLCFENTLVPYYCSEKIWHAIYCGCLPIYFGQKSIYKDFPRNSFIDYATLKTPEALFHLVDNMTGEEFSSRYNKCLAVLHRALPLYKQSRSRVAEYTAAQIQRLARVRRL
jgi:alpha(1,3/1,4) fucosyltransferase